ncbi:RraA family protein [Trinickia terrae]|uniref:Putative 4-hydroxy-4-methyl-2-oxoglutarate aldolase n=1 Tax=Trinickia terrae TaxID=2571161 RepID=A0A4U1I998_9BURK|nr:RraA family protein [Trinickia terrae]TKC90042.1 RraA family protein [Trinickia terrae]
MSNDIVIRLRRLDCCAVSDALDKLGLPPAVGSLRPLSSARRIAGRVITCQLLKAEDVPKREGPVRHLGTTAVEHAGPDDVIVVEQRTGLQAGSWGGILSLAASSRGIAGVVADGLVRDIDEARTLDFPIYARGGTARTARGRVAEFGTNVNIKIDEVEVSPGDYVIADSSGVAFIPAGEAERVLAAAETIATREALMGKDILAGRPVGEVMGKQYEHMLKGA